MKQYYKEIDGKTVFFKQPLIVGDTQVFNPTEEMLLEQGWQVYVPPVHERTLAEAKAQKISELESYDSSEDVNSFYVNGIPAWISHELRSNYRGSLSDAELLGETMVDLPIVGTILTLPVINAKIFLARILRYADACAVNTERHKLAIEALENIEEVENYDYTTGYPEKLNFDEE